MAVRENCFVCPECDKHLSIEIGGVGLLCQCTECQASVRVPDPAIEFLCDSCSAPLAAEEALRGRDFQCPHCMKQTSVPKDPRGGEERLLGLAVKISCPSCSAHLDYDDDFRREMAGRSIDCPVCGSSITIKGTPTERSMAAAEPGAPVLNLGGEAAEDVHSRPTQVYVKQQCRSCGADAPPDKTACPKCGQTV